MKLLIKIYIIFFAFQSFSFAQKDFASVNVELKIPTKFLVIPDSLGNTCLYYKDLVNHCFVLLNSKGEIIRTRTFKKFIPSEIEKSFMGVAVTENAYVFFYTDSPSSKDYFTFYISKSDSNDFMSEKKVLLKTNNDKFIRSFSDQNCMYVISYNNKEEKLNFEKFYNEKESGLYSYKVTKKQYEYINNDDFTIIKNSQNYTVPLACAPKKMYLNETGKIFFTIDNLLGYTEIMEFNFNKDTIDSYKIPIEKDYVERKLTNSFYYDGKLFQVHLHKDKVGVYIYNIRMGMLEKKYEYEIKSAVDLISDKVSSRVDWGKGSSKDTVLKDNSQIFEYLNKGIPSISIKPFKGNTLTAIIGSINVYNPSGPMGIGLLGLASQVHNLTTSTTLEGAIITTTWFNSFFNDSNFDLVSGINIEPDFVKIQRFKDSLTVDDKKNIGIILTFKMQNKFYVGYNLKKEKVFKIVEIL